MNFGMIKKLYGRIFIIIGLLILLPMICTVCYQEAFINYIAFLVPASIFLLFGLVLSKLPIKNTYLGVKESLFIVGSIWIVLALIGALPFVISGVIPNYVDAFFEISSGFTTTGSSILGDIESLCANNKSIFLWRSFSHWIGGMGLIVLVLAIIPESQAGSALNILKAESPGPQVGKLVSRMKMSSRILYLLYIVLTALEFVLLLFSPDLDVYNALIHTFSTAGTGGFSTFNASYAGLCDYAVIVTTVFMILFGVNFSLYYFLCIGKIKEVLKSDELRVYLGIVIGSIVIITLNLYLTMASSFNSIGEIIKFTSFEVASTMSTTGFVICDYSQWPALSKMVIVLLMIIGACAGSTAGGLKVSRVIMSIKICVRKIVNAFSPNRIINIKVDGKSIDDEMERSVTTYVLVYALIFLTVTFLISLDGRCDLITNLSASLTCFNNVGPGFGMVNPVSNFGSSGANYSGFSKIVLSLAMIAGRLEIYPVLILFIPKTYFKH